MRVFFRLVLAAFIIAAPRLAAVEIAPDLPDKNLLDESLLARYFSEKPTSYLVDPQKLLAVDKVRDLEAFLHTHSENAAVDLFVYLFGPEQQFPSDVRKEEITERLFSAGKPALRIHYYLGAPKRAEIFLSKVLTDAVSAAELQRALQSSVMQALMKSDEAQQLEAFLHQISMRRYLMEDIANGVVEKAEQDSPETQPVAADREVTKAKAKIRKLPTWVGIAGGITAASVGAMLILLRIWMWWRARTRFYFPVIHVEPRLGGSHAAGIGAVISFSNASVPPAKQRNQVPDYLRRS